MEAAAARRQAQNDQIDHFQYLFNDIRQYYGGRGGPPTLQNDLKLTLFSYLFNDIRIVRPTAENHDL